MNAKIEKRLKQFMSEELMSNMELVTAKVEILDFIKKQGEITKVVITFDKEIHDDECTITMGFEKYDALMSLLKVKDIDIEDREVTLAIFHDCIGEDIYTPATGGSMVSTVDDVLYIVDTR